MSTTRTSKEDAETLLASLKEEWKGKVWFKKAVIESDDHGWSVGLYLKKEEFVKSEERIPNQTKVKICVYYQ